MQLKYIEEIQETCHEFMKHVIGLGYCLDYNALMEHVRIYCDNYTEHGDDTIDIDYRNMCFTVHSNDNGDWELCENASYYVFKDGFLDTVDGVIDVELN